MPCIHPFLTWYLLLFVCCFYCYDDLVLHYSTTLSTKYVCVCRGDRFTILCTLTVPGLYVYMLGVHSVHLYICTDLNINLKALKIEFISHKTKLSLRFLLVQAHRMGCCSSIMKKNICLFRSCSMILFSLRKKI